jgi:polysaccharide export outer membrane protein
MKHFQNILGEGRSSHAKWQRNSERQSAKAARDSRADGFKAGVGAARRLLTPRVRQGFSDTAHWLFLASWSIFLVCAAGCKAPVFDYPSAATALTKPDSRTNLLQEGDLVSIAFQYSTNFNATQKIPLDGLLNLEGVGPVKASGKTPEQLQLELARLYRPQTKDDVITVKLLLGASGVYVSGAVFRPGRIPMERPMTAFEAVMEAGGFDPNRAKLSAVTILRIEGGRQKTYHLDLKRVLQGADEIPFYLKPFDIVHVPSRTFNF